MKGEKRWRWPSYVWFEGVRKAVQEPYHQLGRAVILAGLTAFSLMGNGPAILYYIFFLQATSSIYKMSLRPLERLSKWKDEAPCHLMR